MDWQEKKLLDTLQDTTLALHHRGVDNLSARTYQKLWFCYGSIKGLALHVWNKYKDTSDRIFMHEAIANPLHVAAKSPPAMTQPQQSEVIIDGIDMRTGKPVQEEETAEKDKEELCDSDDIVENEELDNILRDLEILQQSPENEDQSAEKVAKEKSKEKSKESVHIKKTHKNDKKANRKRLRGEENVKELRRKLSDGYSDISSVDISTVAVKGTPSRLPKGSTVADKTKGGGHAWKSKILQQNDFPDPSQATFTPLTQRSTVPVPNAATVTDDMEAAGNSRISYHAVTHGLPDPTQFHGAGQSTLDSIRMKPAPNLGQSPVKKKAEKVKQKYGIQSPAKQVSKVVTPKKQFICSHCNIRCKAKAGLTNHMRTKHAEKVPPKGAAKNTKNAEQVKRKDNVESVKRKDTAVEVTQLRRLLEETQKKLDLEKAKVSMKKDKRSTLPREYKSLKAGDRKRKSNESKKVPSSRFTDSFLEDPEYMEAEYRREAIKKKKLKESGAARFIEREAVDEDRVQRKEKMKQKSKPKQKYADIQFDISSSSDDDDHTVPKRRKILYEAELEDISDDDDTPDEPLSQDTDAPGEDDRKRLDREEMHQNGIDPNGNYDFDGNDNDSEDDSDSDNDSGSDSDKENMAPASEDDSDDGASEEDDERIEDATNTGESIACDMNTPELYRNVLPPQLYKEEKNFICLQDSSPMYDLDASIRYLCYCVAIQRYRLQHDIPILPSKMKRKAPYKVDANRLVNDFTLYMHNENELYNNLVAFCTDPHSPAPTEMEYEQDVARTLINCMQEFIKVQHDLDNKNALFEIVCLCTAENGDKRRHIQDLSIEKYNNPQLHVYYRKGRFIYIKNASSFIGMHICPYCTFISPNQLHMDRHIMKNCASKAINRERNEMGYYIKLNHIYTTGPYKVKQNLEEKLNAAMNCRALPELKVQNFSDICNDHVLTWDIESVLQRSNAALHPDGGQTLIERLPENMERVLLSTHSPISVAVCSSVPGFTEPKVFIKSGNTSLFIKEFMEYIMDVQKELEEINLKKAQYIFNRLSQRLWWARNLAKGNVKGFIRKLERVKKELTKALTKLPCIGFSSSRYDINCLSVIGFFDYLREVEQVRYDQVNAVKGQNAVQVNIVKKFNKYIQVSSPHLTFLDIQNYLTPSTNLRSFIQTFAKLDPNDTLAGKLYFPYSYLDNASKLDETTMPPYEAFKSDMTGKNQLNEDYALYEHWLETGASEEEALAQCNLSKRPQTGKEKYKELMAFLEKKNVKTIRDYLIIYNIADVEEMVPACRNFSQYFREQGVDPFNGYCTLSSLSFPLMYRNVVKNATSYKDYFYCLPEALHKFVLRAMVGGPSFVMRRSAVKDFSYAGDFHKYGPDCALLKLIMTLDANQMYMNEMKRNVIVGIPLLRDSLYNFRPQPMAKSTLALAYLVYWNEKEKYGSNGIRTYLSALGEKYYLVEGQHHYVDGCVKTPAGDLVISIHGCFFHSHMDSRCPTVNTRNAETVHEVKENCTHGENYEATLAWNDRVAAHADVACHHIVWECDIHREMESNPELKDFVESFNPGPDPIKNELTEEEILTYVASGEMKGFFEIDIDTPPELREKYSYLAPLFVNEDMDGSKLKYGQRDIARKANMEKKSCKGRTMLSQYEAKNIVVNSTLLQFYLRIGLQVTKVHKFVQYDTSTCLQEWGNRMAEERKRAKLSGDKVMDILIKLICNACYGSSMLNPTKFTNTQLISDSKKADKMFRSSKYMSMKNVGALGREDSMHEVQTKPTTVTWSRCMSIGVWTLQNAKAALLGFVYGLMEHLDDRKASPLLMDTDSCAFALADEDITKCCKDGHLEALVRFIDNNIVPSSGPRRAELMNAPYYWKVESLGEAFVAVSSKTYFIFSTLAASMFLKNMAMKSVNRSTNDHLMNLNHFFCCLHQLYDAEESGASKAVQILFRLDKGVYNTVFERKSSCNPINKKFYYPHGYGILGRRLLLEDGMWSEPIGCLSCQVPFELRDDVNAYKKIYPYRNRKCPEMNLEGWAEAVMNLVEKAPLPILAKNMSIGPTRSTFLTQTASIQPEQADSTSVQNDIEGHYPMEGEE